MREYAMQHYLLQGARVPMVFTPDVPASIFVFEAQKPSRPEDQWDFHDSVLTLSIALRMGDIAILAALQDGRAHEEFRTELEKLAPFPLHPIQCRELMAMFFYKAHLLDRVPKFIMVGEDPIQVIQAPIQGWALTPVFREWHNEEFARVLASLLKFSFESVFRPPNTVRSWLRKADGTPNHMPIAQCPWPQ
jgi:hypothetical protein